MTARLALFALLAVAACSPPTASSAASESTTSAVSDYAFQVVLTFSPAAKTKLAGMGEQVNVDAMYWAEPSEAGKAKADEMGQINLNEDLVTVTPSDQTVAVPGTGLDVAGLANSHGEPQVLINVYTARLKDPDNLLDCGIFEGPVREARTTPPIIHCKLITEG